MVSTNENPGYVSPGNQTVRTSLKLPVTDTSSPVLTIVVDDVTSEEQTRQFLELDIPLSFAFLPQADPEAVAMAVSAGCSVLLHAPMEALHLDTGAEVVHCGMTSDEIRLVLDNWLSAIPEAMGVSNHMGSRATSDPRVMRDVLSVLAQRNLLFLDSRTVASSVGRQIAALVNIRFLERDVFLDPDGKTETIDSRLGTLVAIAAEQGYAIGICHVLRNTHVLLANPICSLLDRGYTFGTLMDLLRRSESTA